MLENLIKHIHNLVPNDRKIRIMNVCGSHEHTIAYSGIRSVMPENLELIPGPGCPVCVCPESDIINAINLSKRDDTHGDMLRVPTKEGSIRGEGKNFRMITSPSEAIKTARANPDKKVVFFSIGFETTTAPVAAILETGIPENLYILSAHRLTPTIMEILVKDAEIGIDGFIAPGHVSAIVGSNAWSIFPKSYGIPAVVAGFKPDNLLFGIFELREGKIKVGNVYKGVVKPDGNIQAQRLIKKIFKVSDVNWRGIGYIPTSGLELKEEYTFLNARDVFNLKDIKEERIAGCICDRVILGKAYPRDCKLFQKVCSPKSPKGPCMVSFEGACHIWYKTT